MKKYLLLFLVLFSSSCGVKINHFDIQSQESELQIAEDASISRICLQWLANERQITYEWRCINVRDVRKILFPKAGTW